MSITLGELFIELGIPGAEEAGKKLDVVRGKLKGVVDSSLAVKAGVLAAVYAFLRFGEMAMNRGTDLMHWKDTVHGSIDVLQDWERAGRKVGYTNDAMAATFGTVHDAMTEMITTGSTPNLWLNFLGKLGLGKNDESKLRTDIGYFVQQLNKYGHLKLNAFDSAFRDKFLKQFGPAYGFFMNPDVHGPIHGGDISEKRARDLELAKGKWLDVMEKFTLACTNLVGPLMRFADNIGFIIDVLTGHDKKIFTKENWEGFKQSYGFGAIQSFPNRHLEMQQSEAYQIVINNNIDYQGAGSMDLASAMAGKTTKAVKDGIDQANAKRQITSSAKQSDVHVHKN